MEIRVASNRTVDVVHKDAAPPRPLNYQLIADGAGRTFDVDLFDAAGNLIAKGQQGTIGATATLLDDISGIELGEAFGAIVTAVAGGNIYFLETNNAISTDVTTSNGVLLGVGMVLGAVHERVLMSRGIPVCAVTHGKVLKTASGSFNADTDLVAAVAAKKIKVCAYSFFTFGTSPTTVTLKSDGTGGVEKWRIALQSVASQVMGANLAVAAPAYLFSTDVGKKLTADTNTTDTVHYSITYFDDEGV